MLANLPVPLQLAYQWIETNGKAVFLIWVATTLGFWLMGGFSPAIAQAPYRMRKQLTVRATT